MNRKELIEIKKILSVLIIFSVIISCINVVNAETQKTILYVSTDGDDSANGSIDSPLATFMGAREEIRELRKAGNTEHITVYFKSGEYRFNSTAYLYDEDSNVTYCAYPGETPIFTGGYRVGAEKFEDVVLDNGTTVKKINIKQYLMDVLNVDTLPEDAYYPMTKDKYSTGAKEYSSRVIYSIDNEAALWLARYPNKKQGFYEDNPHTVFMKTQNATSENGTYSFSCTDSNILKYAGYEDVWLGGTPEYLFYYSEHKAEITKSAENSGRITLPAGNVVKDNMSYIIFNLLEELDQPGEYYVSRNGDFYLYPNGEFNYLNVGYLKSEFLIRTSGASNVKFEGITFENSRRNGIYFYGGENMVINDCKFYNFAETAVKLGRCSNDIGNYTAFANYEWADWFDTDGDGVKLSQSEAALEQYNRWTTETKKQVSKRGRNYAMTNSVVKNTGLKGVEISGGNLYTDEECGHYIENCDISFAAQNKRSYEPGISLENCFGVRVSNNEISHVPATGLSGYVAKGVIENNEIYDGLSETTDMGLIYLNYQMLALDLKINNNYLHDVPPEHDITSPNSEASQRSAIAFDNALGSGVKVTNNIIRNIPRGTWLYPVIAIENNMFIDCFDPIYTKDANTLNSWKKVEGTEFFDYETNKEQLGQNYSYIIALPIFIEGETGDAVRALWREKYPEVMTWFDILMNGDHKGKQYGSLKNNLFVNTYKYWWNHHVNMGNVHTATAEELEGFYVPSRKNNVYRTDTGCFADFENEDYTLSYSAEVRYGIKSIDMSKIGILKK